MLLMIEILLIVGLAIMAMHGLASSPSFAPRGGLIYQSEVIGSIALGALSANTAIILASGQNAITATFLMKHADLIAQVNSVTPGDGPFLIGIAGGNATVTEITTAMNEANTVGPTDVTQALTQDNAWVVYQKGVKAVRPISTTQYFLQSSMSFGKGIPWGEGNGWQWFLYNAGIAMTTGATVNGRIRTQGVWLGA